MKVKCIHILFFLGFLLIPYFCVAQIKSKESFCFKPDLNSVDIPEKDSGKMTIKIDSLNLVDRKLDSVLIQIYNLFSHNSIWRHYYLRVRIDSTEVLIQVDGCYSNESLFVTPGLYSFCLKYGFFQHLGRKIYVLIEPNSSIVGIDSLFKKTDRTCYIYKDNPDPLLDMMKYENPMWLFKYEDCKLKLANSANVEYYIEKK